MLRGKMLDNNLNLSISASNIRDPRKKRKLPEIYQMAFKQEKIISSLNPDNFLNIKNSLENMDKDFNKIMHSIVVNAVVFKNDRVLVSQRSFKEQHEPGKWTIPGGKVERQGDDVVFNIIELTLKKEVLEETGVEIENKIEFITNNTFVRSNGQHVVALIFKCEFKSGEAKPLEDTINCKWATKEDIKNMEFAPNVKEYILKAFEVREK